MSLRDLRGRLARRLTWEHRLLLVLILLALLLPRLITLSGLLATPLANSDVVAHLMMLDSVSKPPPRTPSVVAENWYKIHLLPPPRWPDGLHRLAAPVARWLGLVSVGTTQVVNLFFTLFLAVGVVGLGKAAGGLRLGLFALLLTLLTPALYASSLYYGLDYPCVAMVAVGLLLLWHTDKFTRTWVCLLFGIWAGLALLVKLTYAFYLAAPSAFFLVQGLRHRPVGRVLLNLGLSLVLSLGLIFGLHNAGPVELWSKMMELMLGGTLGGAMSTTFNSMTGRIVAYPMMALINFPMLSLLLSVPGLVLLHLRKGTLPTRGLLLVTLWGTYLLFTAMSSKLERYLHPIYPLICMVLAWGVFTLWRGWQRRIAAAVIVLVFSGELVLTLQSQKPQQVISRQTYETLPLRSALALPSYNDYLSLFENTVPSLDVLSSMRKNGYGHYYPQKELLPTLVRLANRPDMNGMPLALARVFPESDDPSLLTECTKIDLLDLMSRVPRRRLFGLCNWEEVIETWTFARLRPDLLIMHGLGLKPEQKLSAARLLSRQQITIHEGGRARTIWLSLIR